MPASTTESASPAAQRLAIDAVRILSMDAVQAARSGHPGTPMALAPLAYRLYTRHLRHDPNAPDWINRDRLILSIGHASMLLYSSLHLAGYKISIDDIRHFRQWKSITPGHPEVHHTPGIETTTGPLGQGVGNAVGFALAEAQLAAHFNRDGHTLIDHYTYFIAGDGCLMEGISHEAASFAGHHKLSKLIGFFDNNHITIDGSTDISCSDDVDKRFTAYGWQTLHIDNVNDLDQIDRAIAEAKADTTRPTLIITRSHIGYGSPNRQDSSKAHGEPLGVDEIALTRKAYNWPLTEAFAVPDVAQAHWTELVAQRAATHTAWNSQRDAYVKAFPELWQELTRRVNGELPADIDSYFPSFNADNGNVASRAASAVVINAIAAKVPELIGGSADLAGSNLTTIKGEEFITADHPGGRNIHFGIREHGMGAILNGMALHGGIIPYGGTFLVFTDYMRPAIRLAALMGTHVIYVYTHDSIGLGEDGPTHQPIEHLSALRAIPGLTVLRPADADEVSEAWRIALHHTHGPVGLVLTRQKLPWLGRNDVIRAGAPRGGYTLSEASGGKPAAVILASGSEVSIALDAQKQLESRGTATRVVSMLSQEIFLQQDAAYQESVLPRGVPRVAVEAAQPMSWYRFIGLDGAVVGINTFGASAPYEVLYKEFGITAEHVVEAVSGVIAS